MKRTLQAINKLKEKGAIGDLVEKHNLILEDE